jgi:uroporphyrinogen decarboxylase
VNPLEIAPMGDVDLAEVKRAWGHKLAFMGNLHTTDIMLRADPETVYNTARQAIRDAGQGGGFILSTGDQCPRDTPEENIFALVRAAKEHGVYDRSTGKLVNP